MQEVSREKKAIYDWEKENQNRQEFNGFVLEDRAKKIEQNRRKIFATMILRALI